MEKQLVLERNKVGDGLGSSGSMGRYEARWALRHAFSCFARCFPPVFALPPAFRDLRDLY